MRWYLERLAWFGLRTEPGGNHRPGRYSHPGCTGAVAEIRARERGDGDGPQLGIARDAAGRRIRLFRPAIALSGHACGVTTRVLRNGQKTHERYHTQRTSHGSGAIGDLVAVHSDFFIGAHFGGFRDVMDHVLILDMTIHSFDQVRFITGRNAERVYCHEWTPRHSWHKHGPSASAIF